jgi:hypothetical protein
MATGIWSFLDKKPTSSTEIDKTDTDVNVIHDKKVIASYSEACNVSTLATPNVYKSIETSGKYQDFILGQKNLNKQAALIAQNYVIKYETTKKAIATQKLKVESVIKLKSADNEVGSRMDLYHKLSSSYYDRVKTNDQYVSNGVAIQKEEMDKLISSQSELALTLNLVSSAIQNYYDVANGLRGAK